MGKLELTANKHQLAFSCDLSRDEFFDDIEQGAITVAAGTAMEHVLATNLGPWGDVGDLRRDAARIMLAEINGLRAVDGFPALDIPVAGVEQDPVFCQAFDACREVNAYEIEQLMRSATNPPTAIEVSENIRHRAERMARPEFTAEIRASIEKRVDSYFAAKSWFDERSANLGFA